MPILFHLAEDSWIRKFLERQGPEESAMEYHDAELHLRDGSIILVEIYNCSVVGLPYNNRHITEGDIKKIRLPNGEAATRLS